MFPTTVNMFMSFANTLYTCLVNEDLFVGHFSYSNSFSPTLPCSIYNKCKQPKLILAKSLFVQTAPVD